MARKPTLADAVHGGIRSAVEDASQGQSPATATAHAPVPDAPVKRRKLSGRQGKKGILIYVEPEMAKQLRQTALDEDTNLQTLGLEAFTALLRGRCR